MTRQVSFERIIILYIPWIFSMLFASDVMLSYFIAWLGSFLIFFLVFTGWVMPLPQDLPVSQQVMRPVFLVHIIFAGYTCCTSIFYLLNVLGYDNFQKSATYFLVDHNKLALVAQCQRYYCLGHTAFISGVLLFMRYPVKPKVSVSTESIAKLLLYIALIAYPLTVVFLRVPGLSQFANQFTSLSFIAGTLALAFAIPQRNGVNTAICSTLFVLNFITALLSGFKEPIIISVLVLGIFLYPTYKRAVLTIFIPALLLLFMFLPTYANVFRQNAWSGNTDSDEAAHLAVDAALNSDIQDTNWTFLVYRLSEIDMFTEFVESTPKSIPFYQFTLINQSLTAIVPRVFWPSKPSTETLVMQRVYDAGIVNRNSSVSAKPAFIVDAYLSFGGIGVFLAMFIYGVSAQLISQKAEKLFGGYLLGTALIFSGLFQIFWRGLSFEFILNNVVWSYVSMLIIAAVLRKRNILKPIEDPSN